MDISKARDHYLFKTTIDLDDGDYIILREPTTLELKDLTDGDGSSSKVFDALYRHFDNCLIDHSFTDGDKKASNEAVIQILKDSGSRFTTILRAWLESLPLEKTSGKKSKQ